MSIMVTRMMPAIFCFSIITNDELAVIFLMLYEYVLYDHDARGEYKRIRGMVQLKMVK